MAYIRTTKLNPPPVDGRWVSGSNPCPTSPACFDQQLGSTLLVTCCRANGSGQSGQLIPLSSLIGSKAKPLSQWEPRRHKLEPHGELWPAAGSLALVVRIPRGGSRDLVVRIPPGENADRGREGSHIDGPSGVETEPEVSSSLNFSLTGTGKFLPSTL